MLYELFNSILPENLKNTYLFKDAIKIFVQNLEQKSNVSIDIINIFNSNNDMLKETLMKIYVSDLFYILTELKKNQDVMSRIQDFYPDSPIFDDVSSLMNEDIFLISKELKERKGKLSHIEYMYNLIQSFKFDNLDKYENITIDEIEPFVIKSTGSMNKKIFDNTVKPLSTPVGFVHDYQQIIGESIQDLFDTLGISDSVSFSSEFNILDNFDFNNVSDDFTIVSTVTGGVYIQTSDDYYLYTTDNRYLTFIDV